MLWKCLDQLDSVIFGEPVASVLLFENHSDGNLFFPPAWSLEPSQASDASL